MFRLYYTAPYDTIPWHNMYTILLYTILDYKDLYVHVAFWARNNMLYFAPRSLCGLLRPPLDEPGRLQFQIRIPDGRHQGQCQVRHRSSNQSIYQSTNLSLYVHLYVCYIYIYMYIYIYISLSLSRILCISLSLSLYQQRLVVHVLPCQAAEASLPPRGQHWPGRQTGTLPPP